MAKSFNLSLMPCDFNVQIGPINYSYSKQVGDEYRGQKTQFREYAHNPFLQ